MTDRLTKRRKFLQSVGVSGTAVLAGCTFFESVEQGEQPDDDTGQTGTTPTRSDETGTTATDSEGNGSDDTDTQDGTDDQNDNTDTEDSAQVGIIAIVDREAMQELQVKLQNNEIDQEEANEQQDEIIQEGIDAVVEQVENTDGVQVDETFSQVGAVLASGAPGGLIAILNSDATNQLAPAENVRNATDG
jgi:hypothetical protein